MAGLTDPLVQESPFEYYAQRLATCPVWHEEDIDLYVIGGHPELRESIMDFATFSNAPLRTKAGPIESAVAYHEALVERGWPRQATLQRTDPPVHSRYRRLLNRVFTPAAVRAYTPKIDQIALELVDSMAAAGECEFVADFALPLPGIFIAEEMGLDRADYRRFRRWADAMLAQANRRLTVDEALVEAGHELEAQHFLAAEFDKRREYPNGDLISLLVHAHGDDEEPLTMGELQDLMHQLITGGFETTTAALSTGMLLLTQHPDQLELLQQQPDLISNFIEEVLRFDSPVQGLWRTSKCPATVAGVEIPADKAVMMRYGAANRDPRVFDEPDRFDITRSNARNHTAFGFGNHFCVGAALARQEMLSAFTILLERLDSFALSEPLPEPAHDPSIFLRPMKRLPISFTVRR